VSFVDSETQHSVQEMETILETLNDGVVIVDDADQILFVNPVFEDSSGIARSEITGREGPRMYERAEDSALFETFRLKALDMDRSREEFFLPTKDGSRLPVVVSVGMIRRSEQSRFAVVTLTDISDWCRRRAYKETGTRALASGTLCASTLSVTALARRARG
jgi:PAS domain S-box-containing protein